MVALIEYSQMEHKLVGVDRDQRLGEEQHTQLANNGRDMEPLCVELRRASRAKSFWSRDTI